MRLLLLTQDFPPDVGGTQTYAYENARRLSEMCSDFAVLAPQVEGAATVDAEVPFDVIRVPATYDTLSIKAWPYLVRLGSRFDTTLHVQWPTALATVLARPFGGPQRIFIASHARELLMAPLPPLVQPAYDAVRSWLLQRADGHVPVSHFTAGLLRDHGVDPSTVTVVLNGTDPDVFHPMPSDDLRRTLGVEEKRVIITVGRLILRKGVNTVLRALPRIREEVPNVAYLVVGDGPDRDQLVALADQLGVSDVVQFLGRVPYEDVPRYLCAGDVFAMPSHQKPPDVEGLPIVFFEASACGLPIIGADTGGIADAIVDGKTGFLIPPEDPDALADRLIPLLSTPERADEMGRRGRRRVVEEASWDHVADRLYRTLAPEETIDPAPRV